MTNDGTHDPVPPPVLADPLAGLVTGARYEPEPLRVRVTEPPMPDISAVREAMASVLDENSELDLASIGPAADFFTDSTGETTAAPPTAPAAPAPSAAPPAAPVAQVPVAQVPTQASGQPAPAPAQAPLAPAAKAPTRGPVTRVTPPSGIPSPRGASTPDRVPPPVKRGEDTRAIRLPGGFMRRRPKVPAAIGSSSLGSVTVIIGLLLVMAVLGIVFLASFIDTVAAVFD
ncbi:MAG TPA: hypothetical protein VH969_21040 [Actinophytocola sp.]|jgi:hypothetical protein|uniref:hypothetical protein n=1 Tax=Actinophytocola sp. TaxID=1872138 RepID=UPI002F91E310